MIGIIGYGFVGKAVEYGFSKTSHVISDPAYNSVTVKDVVESNPDAIFICLPTTTKEDYKTLKAVLTELKEYKGVTVVKSTILPHHIEEYNIVVNPEFLSRGTANEDFVNPPFVLLGGESILCEKLYQIYCKQSIVNTSVMHFTDIKTACLAKYTFNSFYATKLTFMNQIYDVCQQVGVDYNDLKKIMLDNPWIANQHISVPGHEGRGFSGPCLPKDTEALAKEYDIDLLKTVLEINDRYRNS